MRRAELAERLERLGTLPTPLPDPGRMNDWERELYREFVVQPSPTGAPATRARRQRRQILVGAFAVAAAASTLALVLHRQAGHPLALDAASGAVVLLPDGSTQPVHAGDHIPPGGVIHTGPTGSVTIRGTRVGPSQAVLVDDGRLVLLPAPPPTTAPAATQPTATSPTPAPTAPPAPSSTVAPAPAPSVEPPAPTEPAPTTITSPSPPLPAAAVTVVALELTVARESDGVRLSWTTTDAATFERYVVVRGTADATELSVIAELPDRQITSFTDPAAPQNADLLYRVIALDGDGRPVAMSPTAMLQIGASSSTTTTTEPVTTEPPPTDTSLPPITEPAPTDTSAPPTTIHRRHHPPPTTAASTDESG